MTDWHLAPALTVLRNEINARWPHRDRTSDGSIGDAAHQAGTSDHNPNGRGSVNAIDVDRDGVDVPAILAAVERHPSAHYWIFNRQIADRDDGWKRRPYSGSNPHDKHVHVSIRQSQAAEQDRRPWGLIAKGDSMSEKAEQQIAEMHAIITAWRSGMPKTPDGRNVEPVGWRIRDEAWQRSVSTALGQDPVDEKAVAVELLKVLTPTAIAAALPDEVARQVADELGARLGQARE
ncbi:hypothetical protein ABZ847_29370 [Streptomyces bauhiniae]